MSNIAKYNQPSTYDRHYQSVGNTRLNRVHRYGGGTEAAKDEDTYNTFTCIIYNNLPFYQENANILTSIGDRRLPESDCAVR